MFKLFPLFLKKANNLGLAAWSWVLLLTSIPCLAAAAKKAEEPQGLAAYYDVLWIVFYVLLGLLTILIIWEAAIQFQLKKYGEAGLTGGVPIDEPRSSKDKEGEQPLMSDNDNDSFKALLSKAQQEEEPRIPYNSADPQEHVRRSDHSHKPSATPDIPQFDGSATISVAAGKIPGNVPTPDIPQFDGSATISVAAGKIPGNIPAAPQSRPVPPPPRIPPQPIRPMAPGGAPKDDSNPFQRLAKIGAEEGGANSFGGPAPTPKAPIPVAKTPTIPVQHTPPRPITPVQPAAKEDPWKKLLDKSDINQPKAATASAPVAPLADGQKEDPWKKLLGGISNENKPGTLPNPPGVSVPKPPSSLPIGGAPPTGAWPSRDSDRKGISLDIKRVKTPGEESEE